MCCSPVLLIPHSIKGSCTGGQFSAFCLSQPFFQISLTYSVDRELFAGQTIYRSRSRWSSLHCEVRGHRTRKFVKSINYLCVVYSNKNMCFGVTVLYNRSLLVYEWHIPGTFRILCVCFTFHLLVFLNLLKNALQTKEDYIKKDKL